MCGQWTLTFGISETLQGSPTGSNGSDIHRDRNGRAPAIRLKKHRFGFFCGLQLVEGSVRVIRIASKTAMAYCGPKQLSTWGLAGIADVCSRNSDAPLLTLNH